MSTSLAPKCAEINIWYWLQNLNPFDAYMLQGIISEFGQVMHFEPSSIVINGHCFYDVIKHAQINENAIICKILTIHYSDNGSKLKYGLRAIHWVFGIRDHVLSKVDFTDPKK